MTSQSAYLLVSHGSRDSHPQIALERLAYLVQQQLEQLNKGNRSILSAQTSTRAKIKQKLTKTTTIEKKTPSVVVETATLEFSSYALHERIQQIAEKIQQTGGNQIKIVPLFLLKGVHVTEDIPAEIAIASQKLSNAIQLDLCPPLGSYPQITELLAHQFSQLTPGERILLSHGSRRPQAHEQIEIIASQLGAKPAYWSVKSSLTQQIEALANLGAKTIGIMPYFLFRGGIIEAIAQQLEDLKSIYPHVTLQLGEPLGATPELANLIVKALS